MKLLFVTCFLLLSFIGDCQKMLKGIVNDEVNKQPVNKAAVFINGTSIGISTNERGEFVLPVPFGRHVLIGLSSGFEPFVQFISSEDSLESVTINLKPKISATAGIDNYEKDGWEKWGEYFLTNFLGTPESSGGYKIKNKKVVHFRVSEQTKELSAFADEPLINENKTLGYTIHYKLHSFNCNFNTFIVSYTGFCFFQAMNGSPSQQRVWEKRRSLVYPGSIMHFMRSVYRNRIEEEGFEVRSLKKVRNVGTETNESTSDLSSLKMTDSIQPIAADEVNAEIQDQILNPDNYKDIVGPPVPGDSIAYAIGKTRAGLYFDDFLLINYKQVSSINEQLNGTGMMSQLALIKKRPLEIEPDGSFYDYRDLIILGYWTWSEKVYRLLPFDYIPTKIE